MITKQEIEQILRSEYGHMHATRVAEKLYKAIEARNAIEPGSDVTLQTSKGGAVAVKVKRG